MDKQLHMIKKETFKCVAQNGKKNCNNNEKKDE